MRVHIVEGKSEGNVEEQIAAMSSICGELNPAHADILFCMSIDTMKETIRLHQLYHIPYAVYCWDYYSWAHDGRHPGVWDWKAYKEFLYGAMVVIVPSNGQRQMLFDLTRIVSRVVKTGIKPIVGIEPIDGGYILDPMRYYPERCKTWAEDAARELGIPIIHPEHGVRSREEFEALVAGCTFMTSCYDEASTGGLTLMEGMALGKMSLISNSEYQGANDYVRPHCRTFRADDFRALKRSMRGMWTERPKVDIMKARAHLEKFTFERMARQITNILYAIHRGNIPPDRREMQGMGNGKRP